ncbi:zinc-ribbon and DUF3426 domain-containing protein [Variovorax robiniae]|uniref:Zinc-ribbon and DUF3426 domain-containing protein n=1 Tax=Variovorax robiniae TaxID=1836199 RepID=A0ABU8X463_9BURK
MARGPATYNARPMSLVTRCPSCETTFKVVRDQLRISDGWVRCGRCSHVFDATLDLREAPDAVSMPAASEEAVASAASEAQDEPLIEIDLPIEAPETQPARLDLTRKVFEAEAEADAGLESGPKAEQDSEPEPEVQSAAAPQTFDAAAFVPPADWPSLDLDADDPWPAPSSAPPRVESPAIALPGEPMPVLAQHSLSSSIEALDDFSAFVDESSNAQLQKALRLARVEAVRNARARRAAAAIVPEAQDAHDAPLPAPVVTAASIIEAPAESSAALPPFAQAPVAARGERTPGRRIVIVLVFLVVLLALQWARHERDALVAREPSLRPALEGLCKLTGCEISALRQIAAITIDGASFARDKTGDGYRLDFTLRSSATTPLAMPAVELSLLDTQERTLVRRVLMPADFGAPAVLGPKAERSASLPLALTGPDAADLSPVAGYRVVAFYP